MENWRNEVNGNLRDMTKNLQELIIEVRQRPTRPEIEQMLSTKVGVDIFNAELKGVRDDVAELQRKPENFRSWTGTVVGVGGCAMTIISVVLSTLISLAVILLQHWH